MPYRLARSPAWTSALLGLALGVLHARPLLACVRPEPLEFALDPAAVRVDRQAPTKPARVTASVTRTSGFYCASDGICLASSCGSAGSLQLLFTPAADERLPANELGYQLRWLEGSLPAALEEPLRRIVVGTSPLQLELPFDPIPELDATFELIAIDRAGNESDASEPFHVAFDGCTRSIGIGGCAEETSGRVSCVDGTCFETREASGCALGRAASVSASGWVLVVAACALARWRHARRRSGR